MGKILNKPFWIIVFCLLGLCGVSCTAVRPVPNEPTAGAVAAVTTVTAGATVVQSAPLTTARPVQTPTTTPPPMTTETSTSMPSATATLTPLPTLPPEEALATVFMLFETNRGCQLPCWWGFTPGQTDWITAKQFLSPIAKAIYEGIDPVTSRWGVEIYLPNTNYTNVSIIHNYLIEEGILQAFAVWMKSPSSLFTPASVLDTYGMPKEIYLRSGQGDTGYLMTFFYPQSGFHIGYAIEGGTNENGIISACFQGNEFVGLTIWSPERDLSFTETYTLFRREDSGDYQIPLDIAAGMDVPTFYETFRNPEVPICLETPADIWPGY